ncbi:hypothetical protein BD770DRAFT_466929 [Pilaira anomala]|nr:hypothetical protein BD770DRAFT_466929 [Pilaira anomala]
MLTFGRQTFPASEITQRYYKDYYRFCNRDGYTGYYIREDQRIYREEFIAAIDLSSYYYDDANDELANNDGISSDDDSIMLSYFNIRPDEMPSNEYLNDPVFIQRFHNYSDVIVKSIIDSYSSNYDNYSGDSSSTGYNSYSEEEIYDIVALLVMTLILKKMVVIMMIMNLWSHPMMNIFRGVPNRQLSTF